MEGFKHTPERSSRAQLYSAAESLKARHASISSLVQGIQEFLETNSASIPEEQRREAQTILESRLISAGDAFECGMLSCGSMATIGAEMLRHVGYEVRLIHGESAESVDHAWIEILNPDSKQWEAYDLTRNGLNVPETHIKKAEAYSWHDIESQLHSDHESLIKRRKERDITTDLED